MSNMTITNYLQRIKAASYSTILYIDVRRRMSKFALLLGSATLVTCKLPADFQSQPVWIFCRPRKLPTDTTSRTTTGTQHFNNLKKNNSQLFALVVILQSF